MRASNSLPRGSTTTNRPTIGNRTTPTGWRTTDDGQLLAQTRNRGGLPPSAGVAAHCRMVAETTELGRGVFGAVRAAGVTLGALWSIVATTPQQVHSLAHTERPDRQTFSSALLRRA